MRYNIVAETTGGQYYFNLSASSRQIALQKAANKIRESSDNRVMIIDIVAYPIIRNGEYETYPYTD